LLSTVKDINNLDPSHLPFYTHMSGTSMAAPHVSGVIALMLEANPLLSPSAIKDIIQSTSTPMSDYELWEAGAGYVDAYSAVDYAFSTRQSDVTTNNTLVATSSGVTAEAISETSNEIAYSITSYPNPFGHTTFINYTIPNDGMVNLTIFDRNGNKVTTLVNEYQVKGAHQVNFEGTGIKPGLYIAKIKAGQYLNILKMIAE
jgi:subtilisin family serine protease